MTILSIKTIRLIIKQCKQIIEIRLLFWVKKKKAHQAIDVTHGFINFMPDVSLQKTIASQFSHYVSKIFSSYKNLNKASIYKMYKHIFQKTDALSLALIS